MTGPAPLRASRDPRAAGSSGSFSLPGAGITDRGQVGIGTLVVFIALVLVAAIAAGVLINTAGFLQTQAESTGSESTQQVADNLNVITTVGTVDGDENAVDTVRIGVQPASGADNLNLEAVTIQYVSDDSFGNLVHLKRASVDGQGTVFNTEAVTAEDGTDNVMTGNSDRYEIVIPLNESQPFFERDGEIDETDAEANEYAVVDEEGDSFGGADEGVRFDEDVDPTELDGFTEGITEGGDDGFTEEFIQNLGNAGDLDDLGEGEEAELTLTTDTAAQTRAILQVPDSLAGQDDDSTIDL